MRHRDNIRLSAVMRRIGRNRAEPYRIVVEGLLDPIW